MQICGQSDTPSKPKLLSVQIFINLKNTCYKHLIHKPKEFYSLISTPL